MLSEATNRKLSTMYDESSLAGKPVGYPDPLDLLDLLYRHPDLDETIDFWEFRKAYDRLSETAQKNHSNGRHLFLDGEELAHRAGCSIPVLVAAAIQLGLKRHHHGSHAFKFPPFKFPPFKESSGSPAV